MCKDGYLGYDTALAAGWPDRHGIVEGACLHLIGDRRGPVTVEVAVGEQGAESQDGFGADQ
ncbi:hypothetical protein ACQPXS_44070 [Streptomyces sp. CA-142005]|uniref:hypothetical protein n=1 Tax=Streptomyces sp. CA-142005 TaxID=3240052 RepID=UPI003D8F502D